MHIIAEGTTLALAIAVHTRGLLFGKSWIDPIEGWARAGVIGVWAFGPVKGTSRVLVDRKMENALAGEVRWAVESPSTSGR